MLNSIKKLIPKYFFDKLKPFYHFSLAYLANLWYFNPSSKMIVIGITGTTGKTSSVYLMAKALNEAGYKTGYTSTAMFGDGNSEWLNNKKMTMTGRFFIQKMLNRMHKNGCLFAIVETTSEGIKQFRHRFINYDIAIITSLYPEHIESHGSFENYKAAKGELFAHLSRCKYKYLNRDNKVVRIKDNIAKINNNKLLKTIIANQDNEHANYFLSFTADNKISYSNTDEVGIDLSQIFFNNIKAHDSGLSFNFVFTKKESDQLVLKDYPVKSSLLGTFNVQNTMPLLSMAVSLDLNIEKIISALEDIASIPGRLERVDIGQKFLAIVDYAYEPVALEKLYQTIDFIKNSNSKYSNSKIVHILGSAGGGRDKSRRPILGSMAGSYADIVIVSNEDPYDENPLDIINEVSAGVRKEAKIEGSDFFRILDRREAIKKALSLMNDNDILLLTGKGSEQAICVADGRKIAWDDRSVLAEEIKLKM